MVWFLLAAFNKLLIKIKIMHAIYNPNGYGIFVIFMYTKWGQYTYRTVKEDLLFPVCVKSVQIVHNYIIIFLISSVLLAPMPTILSPQKKNSLPVVFRKSHSIQGDILQTTESLSLPTHPFRPLSTQRVYPVSTFLEVVL